MADPLIVPVKILEAFCRDTFLKAGLDPEGACDFDSAVTDLVQGRIGNDAKAAAGVQALLGGFGGHGKIELWRHGVEPRH